MPYNATTKAIAISLLLLAGCKGQGQVVPADKKRVGGACDGCEIMYVNIPAEPTAVDTSAGWYERGQKLVITGKVLQPDGRTPAAGVIVYYYHTDVEGRYAGAPGLDEKARLHGRLRGWVRTGADGAYRVHTIRPGHYPGRNTPAHIHLLVKEPRIANEYYIDDLVFDDDPLLTSAQRKGLENRGGSGILRVVFDDSVQVAEHNIILGLNVPGYPAARSGTPGSGLAIGEDNPSFMPYHAWGPDKGKQVCPVCKYGRYHGIMYFVGNHPNWEEIRQWLLYLEGESVRRKQYLKAYFVYGNAMDYNRQLRQAELEKLGRELGLTQIALTFVPSMHDEATEVFLNKINPEVENTFVIYRHRNIVEKQINLKPTPENFRLLSRILDSTRSPFFHLPEPRHD